MLVLAAAAGESSLRGRMEGSARASTVLPALGGPLIRTLCAKDRRISREGLLR